MREGKPDYIRLIKSYNQLINLYRQYEKISGEDYTLLILPYIDQVHYLALELEKLEG